MALENMILLAELLPDANKLADEAAAEAAAQGAAAMPSKALQQKKATAELIKEGVARAAAAAAAMAFKKQMLQAFNPVTQQQMENVLEAAELAEDKAKTEEEKENAELLWEAAQEALEAKTNMLVNP